MAAGVAPPLLLAGALLAGVLLLALRNRVLFRMGLRNALRRKTQSLVVVLGLMVGTAILSGSLATGDSLAYGIRRGAYDGLGPADEFLHIEGNLYFPEAVYEHVARDAALAGRVAAVAPLVFDEAAISHPAAGQAEPRVAVLGLDPVANRPFGRFTTLDGRVVDGSDLEGGELYVDEEVGAALAARPGDAVRLSYAIPPAPLLPRIFNFSGRLAAGAGACPHPLPVCEYVAPPADRATFTVPVGPGAARISVMLVWFGPGGQASDLDPRLVSPRGDVFVNANGTPARPDVPAFLNVTPARGEDVEAGEWRFEVRSKVAVDQPFQAFAFVFHPVYDLGELRNFTKAAEAAGLDPERFGGFAGDPTRPRELRQANFTVKEVVRREGMGDFLLGRNVFLPLDRAQALYEREGEHNLLLVSNTGLAEGEGRSREVSAALNASLAALREALPDDAAVGHVQVEEVKRRWVEDSERFGKLFKQFLTTIGSFTILAGVMLIVNIFVMLAEERKSELGMARAVGLTRGQLVLLFAFEGTLYAAVASLLGVFLGLGLAAGLIRGLNELVQATPDSLITVTFHPEPSGMAWAFAAGFLLTLATVAIASYKVSKLNVVAAIRRLEEPDRGKRRGALWGGALLLAAGLGLAWLGFAGGVFALKILSPSVAVIGLALVLARWIRRQNVYPVAGAAVALYNAWTILGIPQETGLLNQVLGPVRGMIIVLAVVLIVVHVPQLVTLSKRLLLRVRVLVPSVNPGVSYPLAKRVRTGLTMTMFSLVILVVVVFSVFGATFAIRIEDQTGGYDVEAETTLPIEDLEAHYRERTASSGAPDPFPRIARVDALVYGQSFGGDFVTIGGKRINYQGPPIDQVYSMPAAFAANNGFALESRHPRFASDADAYAAVSRDPTLAIASSILNFDEQGQPGAHAVGDTLTFHTPSGPVNFTIAGFQKQMYLGGIFVAEEVVETTFQRLHGEFLLVVNPGEDPAAVARDLERAFQDSGMNAVSIEEAARRQLEQNRQFLTLFQLYLGFGLVVGIASLGIVTARSVIERRQEIGVLRAIGYPGRAVFRIFLIEIVFTVTLATLIGMGIGIFVAWGVTTSTENLESLGVEFTVPWLDVLRILGITYVAVLAATYLPARRAAKVAPAEAVRYIE